MKKLFFISFFSFYLIIGLAQNYNDVAVIVNDSSQVSIDIGNYFQAARNVPAQNIIHINVATDEEIDSLQFEDLRQQVENYLTTNNLVDSINYLVTTKGVPLKVNRGNCINTSTRCASVDNELALILGAYSSNIGNQSSYMSPYFLGSIHFDRDSFDIYLVTRLDGYTKQDVLTLIDRSGPDKVINVTQVNCVFDINGIFNFNEMVMYSAYQSNANDKLEQKGFTTIIGDTSAFLTNQQNVFTYFHIGMDSSNTPLNFTWTEGSIAEMLGFTTAGTFYDSLNTNDLFVVADLISEGATGAKGYTYGAFATDAAPTELVFDIYTDTSKIIPYNLAESYYLGMSRLSWTNVVIGDPKTSVLLDYSTGLNDKLEDNSSFTVYPNPTSGKFTVANATAEIQIFDLFGRLVLRTNEAQIDMSSYPSGLYIWQVGTERGKLVLE